MHWWTPEALYAQFLGSEGEFVRVTLPPTTQECLEARVHSSLRCDTDLAMRVGSPEGACDETSNPLLKLIATGLYRVTYNPEIEEANRSPGYDAVKSFRVSSLQLAQIFQYWQASSADIYWDLGPRDAVCQFVSENIDYMRDFIPKTYPRVMQDKETWNMINFISLGCSGLALIAVIGTAGTIVYQRERPIMRMSQIEFMLLIVTGLFLVSSAALILSFPPTTVTCSIVPWLVNMGYTLEFVPLIVKIFAIHTLMLASKQMKRVVLTRQRLFGAVFGLSSIVVLFLILWMALDAPKRETEYALTTETTSKDGHEATIVTSDHFCKAKSEAWTIASLGTLAFLLVCASLLAFQTRNHRKDMNESKQLAVLVYSKCLFIFLRLCMIFLVRSESMSSSTAEDFSSLIFSIDVMATIPIYFLPKFIKSDEEFEEIRRTSTMVARKSQDSSISPLVSGGLSSSFQKSANQGGVESTYSQPVVSLYSIHEDQEQSQSHTGNDDVHQGTNTGVINNKSENNVDAELVPLMVCSRCGAEQSFVPKPKSRGIGQKDLPGPSSSVQQQMELTTNRGNEVQDNADVKGGSKRAEDSEFDDDDVDDTAYLNDPKSPTDDHKRVPATVGARIVSFGDDFKNSKGRVDVLPSTSSVASSVSSSAIPKGSNPEIQDLVARVRANRSERAAKARSKVVNNGTKPPPETIPTDDIEQPPKALLSSLTSNGGGGVTEGRDIKEINEDGRNGTGKAWW